jgi:hypothetical protein
LEFETDFGLPKTRDCLRIFPVSVYVLSSPRLA